MRHPANHIFEFTPETLAAWCNTRRMQPFRATQILEWVYEKGIADPAQMSNLSKLDRETLARDMTFLSGSILTHQRATDGVQKLLIEWDDAGGLKVLGQSSTARQTECVMIPSEGARQAHDGAADEDGFEMVDDSEERQAPPSRRERAGGWDRSNVHSRRVIDSPGFQRNRPSSPTSRYTACISSQVGCPVRCRFCASGLGGLDASLSHGRIVEQIWRLGRLDNVRRITNVVFMGMGEPLSNLGAVIPAIRTITALWGLGISARKITVSTVGLPKAIDKLAEQLDLPVTLALSLHAPTDELRRQLIPWAEYTTIKDLLAACQRWFERTGREVTLEYTLLRNVNDRREHAEALSKLAATLRANVNLIRYNEVAGIPFERPITEDVRKFQDFLRDRRINTHIRASRGRDIAAACGQLRHEASAATPTFSTPAATEP